MSLKKKIISGFLISALIIGVLAAFEYLNFVEIRKEIINLEFAGTVRSKALQLRRHEKNFFLLSPLESQHELKEIRRYLEDINAILINAEKDEGIGRLKTVVDKYRDVFERIEETKDDILQALGTVKATRKEERMIHLIKVIFLEQPIVVAELLDRGELFSDSRELVSKLRSLHLEIQALRAYGEEIITISKELDKKAREKVERTISISQKAILIFSLVFLITGLGILFFIIGGVIKRLRLLTTMAEKAGRGEFIKFTPRDSSDEVGTLIKKFNEMEEELLKREGEIREKNEELIQSKKLAVLGTLAAGVAHELNNPLNNIYISAQILKRESVNLPGSIQETVDDIMAQSRRVKHIVSDLLEFARGREPVKREIDLKEAILGSYKFVSTTRNTGQINFVLDVPDDHLTAVADPEQMERVFINLFNNAIDAMDERGDLVVTLRREDNSITIRVTDTGKGIPPEVLEKVFEPFYTTKDRGTGLGLAIVYNIVMKHGWDISVESMEGWGTTFIIKTTEGDR